MSIQIRQAQPEEAAVVAALVGELLHEIMTAVSDKVFNFHQAETEARAAAWLRDGLYSVLLARDGEVPIGFLALYPSYALYTEGAYGTIPEFYVRPAHRSKGVGAGLLEQASITRSSWSMTSRHNP